MALADGRSLHIGVDIGDVLGKVLLEHRHQLGRLRVIGLGVGPGAARVQKRPVYPRHGDRHLEAEDRVAAEPVSPLKHDFPMIDGALRMARAGQAVVVTPFTLAGAMAPVTLSGAVTLSIAEALSALALIQYAAPGAPVMIGTFTSNVDMKSGAPAFGTPEHLRANLGSGQLARLIGLPWRSATGAASNVADAQGAGETVMALWGAVLAQATLTIHAAGWLEGGLTFGYEKFICDIEALQTIAELAAPAPADAEALAFDAIAEVPPGGHFFAATHTMDRYASAFYQPLVADLSNHGQWTEAGGLRADERATAIWQRLLDGFTPPPATEGAAERIARFVADRTAAGGVAPED